MKMKKTHRLGALLLAMMMLFTTLPVTALAEAPETEMPGVEESANAAPATEQTSENAGNGEFIKEDTMPEEQAAVSEVHRAPAPTTTKNLTVEVTLDTTMRMIMNRDQSYTFRVNGEEYKIPVTSNTGTGPITFTAKFPEVPFPDGQTEADVKLERSPNSIAADHAVVEQKYDPNTKKLHATLGREIYIKVSDIKDDVSYENSGSLLNVEGFELTLYQNGVPIQQSELFFHASLGAIVCKFSGVKPGKYKLKITKVPVGYEEYDIGKEYDFEVDETGYPFLEIYQKDGSYHKAKANGCVPAPALQDNPMLSGYKTTLLLLLAKKSTATKVILTQAGEEKKLEVGKDDIVTYTLKKTIHPDHKTVYYFYSKTMGTLMNIGAYVDQGFTDTLDHNLEFQEGSLKLTLDGKETDAFVASYDAQSHTVSVKDKSKVNVLSMDLTDMSHYRTPVKLGEPQTLEVTFKVKVLKAEDTIVNKVDDSTTELIPFTVKVEKHWDDQENQAGKRPAFVQIQLKADGEVLKTVEVTAQSDWKYTFTDLRKKNDEGKEIMYTVEELPVEGYKTSIDGDAQNGFTVTNKFLPPPLTPRIEDVSIPVKKVWEDDGNRENLRPTSVTVRLYADGKDTGKSVVLTEANGWKGRFDALPKYDAGKRITYTVKEERVAHYASSVSGSQTDGYTVTNRVEEPPKPPTPPTPPTPPIPPTILVPRIPRAGVGA